jgi:hypothetical protein
MNNAQRIVRLVAGFMLIGVPTVAAQTPPPTKNIYVDFNFGVQPSAQTFSITTPNPPQIVYGESVILSGTQGINGSTLIDIMGGYRVWKNFSVALGFDTTIGSKGDASVTAGIPHPIFFDTRKESTHEVTDLSHSEQAIHLAFMWTTPISDKMDASVYCRSLVDQGQAGSHQQRDRAAGDAGLHADRHRGERGRQDGDPFRRRRHVPVHAERGRRRFHPLRECQRRSPVGSRPGRGWIPVRWRRSRPLLRCGGSTFFKSATISAGKGRGCMGSSGFSAG